MAQKDKAKAYDKALEKARQLCAYPTTKPFISDLQDLFPELQESEDEMVRNEMISYFKQINYDNDHTWNGVNLNKFVDWLEKQGEHANFLSKIQVGDKVTRNEDGVLVNLSQLNRVAKPADKIKPKFHEGDWVVYEENIYQIHNISLKKYYECLRTDGTVHVFDFEYIDSKSHLWTIQDAKEGDVLAVEPIEKIYHSSFIAIYEERGLDFFNSYCFIGFDGKFYEGETGHAIEGIHPATKEQRDTLMKAMADAVYTFDFENKKLKKVEEPENFKNQVMSEITDLVKDHITQEPTAWSDEDETKLKSACALIRNTSLKENFGILDSTIIWLKSLKNRVQPMQ